VRLSLPTVIKVMEPLPETAQDQVAEHLRAYLEDLQDELQWASLLPDLPRCSSGDLAAWGEAQTGGEL